MRVEPEPEDGAPSISFVSFVRPVRANRNFGHLWLAQIVSEIGDQDVGGFVEVAERADIV